MNTSDLSSEDGKISLLHIQKNFQFYRIVWDIEYMYVECCQENVENVEICSPEVEGPRKTKLMLSVKPTDTDFAEGFEGISHSFLVKRSASDFGPETLWVNFRVDISGPFDQPKCVEENMLCCLTKGTEIELIFTGMDLSFDKRKVLEHGSTYFECMMIIYIDDENAKFDEFSDEGLKTLSNEILTVCEPNLEYDIELKIGSKSIQAHKSNLCAHSGFFKRVIDPNKVTKSLDLSDVIPDEDYEAVVKVVAFICTGDFKHVLEKPSLSIYELAHMFDIQALKKYYSYEALTFASRIELQEFIFEWSVRNFKSVLEDEIEDKQILSPVLTDCDSGRTFQLHLCLQEYEDYPTIYVEANKEIEWTTIWLEVSFTDEDENLLLTTMEVFDTENDGLNVFEFKGFVNRNWIKTYITSNILNMGIRLKLFTGRQNSETVKHEIASFS